MVISPRSCASARTTDDDSNAAFFHRGPRKGSSARGSHPHNTMAAGMIPFAVIVVALVLYLLGGIVVTVVRAALAR